MTIVIKEKARLKPIEYFILSWCMSDQECSHYHKPYEIAFKSAVSDNFKHCMSVTYRLYNRGLLIREKHKEGDRVFWKYFKNPERQNYNLALLADYRCWRNKTND